MKKLKHANYLLKTSCMFEESKFRIKSYSYFGDGLRSMPDVATLCWRQFNMEAIKIDYLSKDKELLYFNLLKSVGL